MRLINAQIKNYKGIEQLRLQFNPGFHLIRGAGQATSILEALATALCGFTSEIEGVSTRHFSKDEIRKVYSMSDDGSCECSYFVPLEVTIVTYMDGVDIPLRWTRGKSSIHASKSNLLPREVANLARRFARRWNTSPIRLWKAACRRLRWPSARMSS